MFHEAKEYGIRFKGDSSGFLEEAMYHVGTNPGNGSDVDIEMLPKPFGEGN